MAGIVVEGQSALYIYMWVVKNLANRATEHSCSSALGLVLDISQRIPSPDPMQRLDTSCDENKPASVATELVAWDTWWRQKARGLSIRGWTTDFRACVHLCVLGRSVVPDPSLPHGL